ncbi:LOW QUALITY PROTEIN: hypothetical protein ACHAW6_009972 [Cyclotella cf. meneghiniana]
MNQLLTDGLILMRRDRIVSLVMCQITQYHKQTHKFGIELPNTVEEAYAIDHVIGTTSCCDSIKKEMKNVHVAFDILGDGVASPPNHQYIGCHMIFDFKMEDFHCKA